MRKKLTRCTLSLAIGFALSGAALAQSEVEATGTEQAEDNVLEEVIVTGSRLRRDSYNISTPLVTMDSQAIEDSGLGSIAEILIDEIPQVDHLFLAIEAGGVRGNGPVHLLEQVALCRQGQIMHAQFFAQLL